jgi:hypothetical protein
VNILFVCTISAEFGDSEDLGLLGCDAVKFVDVLELPSFQCTVK